MPTMYVLIQQSVRFQEAPFQSDPDFSIQSDPDFQHRALPSDDDMTQAFEDLARDRFILGDPDECAAEINHCVEATGATTMLLRVHWPGMPHEVITQAMRLLAEKVRPQLT